jgi:putative transposase
MEVKVISLEERAKVEAKSYLEQLLSEGARKLLQAAIENEVSEYIQGQSNRRAESGERSVVRNGSLPERDLVTGVGPVKIRQPRVRYRDGGTFSSEILPKYMRRVPSIDALIPALYLKGISTGDFTEALSAILGEKAAGLSATNIVRLKAGSRGRIQGLVATGSEHQAVCFTGGPTGSISMSGLMKNAVVCWY